MKLFDQKKASDKTFLMKFNYAAFRIIYSKYRDFFLNYLLK